MANDVIFINGQGGLGRPLPGTDYVSGHLFYSAALPSGFASNDRIKIVYSVNDAEALGITNTHIGETKATGTITVTGAGTAGDTIAVSIVTDIGAVLIATAVVPATPTTTTVAAAIAAAINAGTTSTGYTATSSSAVVTVNVPGGLGIAANTFTFSNVITGTATATNVAFSGGVASDIDILHYHVSEFFRIQPKGKLYVGVYATADVATWASITLMQNFATGEIKQMFVYQKTTAFATSQTTTIQAVCTALEAVHKPLQIVYQADFSGVTDLTTLTNLRLLSNPNVTVVIGQDGANVGKSLWRATAKSIGCGGTTLGAIALAAVNEDIAWIGKFNMAADEFDTLAFANGQAYTALSDGLINNLDAFGYVFLKKQIGVLGSYFDDSHTCVALTSDYAYIENTRTIYKAIRSMRTILLPDLASPIVVNADGTLSEDVISYFTTQCKRALEQMQRDGELSQFNIIINPAQNVLSTSTLFITAQLVPVGVARTIQVNVGFVTSISN